MLLLRDILFEHRNWGKVVWTLLTPDCWPKDQWGCPGCHQLFNAATWWRGPSCCYHMCSPSQHWPCTLGWRKHFCLCANAALIVFATILITIKGACTFAFLMLSVKKNCLALVIIDGWKTLAWFKQCSFHGLSDPLPSARLGLIYGIWKSLESHSLPSSMCHNLWREPKLGWKGCIERDGAAFIGFVALLGSPWG